MSFDSVQDRPAYIENVSVGEVEAESNNIDSLEVISSVGDTTYELESAAEILTRLELDLARSSEKLVNLDILVMHVASRENDFEAFACEEEPKLEGPVEKALEFDLLYGFLDSEVRELESFLSLLQTEIISSQETISSLKQLRGVFKEMDDKLHDCEDSLKQCFEQVLDIKVQSDNFQKILLAFSGDDKWKDYKELGGLENGDLSDLNAKIKMQTAEQRRNILRMLEKSLAREMDIEKKLTESRQAEEGAKLRMQQEIFCMEEEAEDLWERLFEAENSAEILFWISRELFGQIQMAESSLNGPALREGELRSKIQDLKEQLTEKDCALQGSETLRTELVEKVSSLAWKLREFESQMHLLKDSFDQEEEFKGKATDAEKRTEIAEAECKLLRDSNMELEKNVCLLQSNIADASERLGQLERQLKDSEVKRLHAVASAEASQEKQNMLECMIKDMENLIKDLKLKVSKAESQTESAEEKCIVLSESNAELIEEINFLRRRTQHLETSLHQADEAKKGTAKDIRVRTKLIAELVMQLALERERLHKQISSLAKEKKVAVMYLQQTKDSSVATTGSCDEDDNKNGTSRNKSNLGIMGSAVTSHEVGGASGELSTSEIKTADADSTSELNTVRHIGARQLKFNYIFIAVLVLAISALAAFLFQQSEAPQLS